MVEGDAARETLALRSGLRVEQIRALFEGEESLERLPTRLRDDLIARGYARRAWPDHQRRLGWRTWLTTKGVALREALAAGTSSLPSTQVP